MTDLEEYAVALDAFEDLSITDRDYILRAVEAAPDEYPDTEGDREAYFASPAYGEWCAAYISVLAPMSVTRWAVTLHEASGYATIVTKDDILAALHRGKMLVYG